MKFQHSILAAILAFAPVAAVAQPTPMQPMTLEQALAEPPYLRAEDVCSDVDTQEEEIACLQQEQMAYDSLYEAWPDLPEHVIVGCINFVASTMESYQLLVSCVNKVP